MGRQPASAPKPVTLQDIATHCQVTISTVSFALRGDPRVKPATAERIRTAAAKLGYDPTRHQAARRLAMMRQGKQVPHDMVALLFPTHFERASYYMMMLQGVLDAAADAGVGVLTVDGNGPVPNPLVRGEVDGVIVYAHPVGSRAFQDYLQLPGSLHTPIVSMLRPLAGCHLVATDDRQAMHAVVAHLLDEGHRGILHFFTPADDPLQSQRLQGMRNACTEAGYAPESILHEGQSHLLWAEVTQGADPTAADSIHHVCAYVRSHPEVTAICAPNDAIAHYLWYLMQHAGIRVPEAISLVGFDDTDPFLDAHGRNLLSSVHLPLEEVGRESLRMVLRQRQRDVTVHEQVTVPAEFIPRASTARKG